MSKIYYTNITKNSNKLQALIEKTTKYILLWEKIHIHCIIHRTSNEEEFGILLILNIEFKVVRC